MSDQDEKFDASRDGKEEDEEDDDDDDDISSSGGDDDSGSEDDMSESGDHGDSKPTAGATTSNARGGAAGSSSAVSGGGGKERSLANQPFDEAVDLSESEASMSEDASDSPKKVSAQIKNQPFDEALELSGSVQDIESPQKPSVVQRGAAQPDKRSTGGAESAPAARASNTAAASAVGAELKNNPFDEEVDLSDSGDSVDTDGHPSPDRATIKAKGASASSAASIRDNKPAPVAHSSPAPAREPAPTPASKAPAAASAASTAASRQPALDKRQPEPKRKQESESESEESGSDEDEEEDEEEEEEEEAHATPKASASSTGASAASAANSSQSSMMANAGTYKESDYANLKVSNDVRELFQYIGRFKAQEIELETRLKCFIPEYIPAVGDMDAFLKIPRPDSEPDHLGLKMLDEPSLSQSDATVLDLQLRSTSKKKHGDIVVRSIENAEKSPKEIDRWIKSIADLHRSKPPPQVHYSKTMPDIESLMQVWPEEFEELLAKTPLPSASMDLALEQYVRIICALLDIPVHKNVYESLHVLFTLYLEFRSNQHFMNYDEQLESAQHQQQQQLDQPPPFTSRRVDIGTPDSVGSRK